MLREHEHADETLTLAWDGRTQEVVAPYFRSQERADHARIAEMEALRDGRPLQVPGPSRAELVELLTA